MGSCLQNREFPPNIPPENGSALIPIYSQYYFTLAFEDSNTHDYVDEKLFIPLIAGSVPVFSGTKNVRDFTPSENSIVDIRDFESPKALAHYLEGAIQDRHQYEEHLGWKRAPLPPRFLSLVKGRLYLGRFGDACSECCFILWALLNVLSLTLTSATLF